MPSICPCGQSYDVTHSMSYKRGGFIVMRHNNVRDFEANLLKQLSIILKLNQSYNKKKKKVKRFNC